MLKVNKKKVYRTQADHPVVILSCVGPSSFGFFHDDEKNKTYCRWDRETGEILGDTQQNMRMTNFDISLKEATPAMVLGVRNPPQSSHPLTIRAPQI